ncbi:MAG: SGNH/GDSL hydrolase family protein [Verrucomicrobiota bacterium]|nr:SGNH/GDSL hydrolase family protein [Verrucomicrobiota bacterium]
MRPSTRFFLCLALASLTLFAPNLSAQSVPAFTQVIVFGDSLSDDGNIRHRLEEEALISYPGGEFNYSDGRFTNSSDTDPNSGTYAGTWHEQLALTFLGLSAATNSLDGGTDYAFGGATTESGTREVTVISNPDPFVGGDFTVTIDNLGKQVDDYLAANTVDPAALYIVWGGGNDLFDDDSAENVTATAQRVAGLVEQLARAGAVYILTPNVPPLGLVPNYKDDPEQAAALNAASADYRDELNAELDASIATLASESISITLYRLDIYGLFYRLAANPEDYGFVNISDSSQGESVDPDEYLFWDDIHPTTAGHYQIAVAAFNLLNGTAEPAAQSLNLSARLNVGVGDDVLIGGLIVTGTEPKQVIVRGIGPSLTVNGVPVDGTLADPLLELYQGDTLIQSNDNWTDTQQAEIEATEVAPTDDLESAIVATLDPGSYTVILRGQNSGTGIGLVDAYDLDTAAASLLANTSTRGLVESGDDVLIAGFIVGNGGSATVVVRAIGPSLAGVEIANPLADPTLDLYDANGAIIRSDDNWRDSQESLIQSTGLAPTNDLESAIIRSLTPGNYTAVVRGKDGGSGVALVEVYNLQ